MQQIGQLPKKADEVELSQPAPSFSRHPQEKCLQPRTGALLAVLELVAEVEEREVVVVEEEVVEEVVEEKVEVKVEVIEEEEAEEVEVGGLADVEVVHVGHEWGKKEKGNPSLIAEQWFYTVWRLVLGDCRKILGAVAGAREGGTGGLGGH